MLMHDEIRPARSKYFYLDLDNIDPLFFHEIMNELSKEAFDPKTEIVTKVYSSDLKKSYLSAGDEEKYNKINLQIFDLSGTKKFGKEAVDRLVSMDVVSDLIKKSPSDVSFASNDYDFYGTLLFLDRFFEGVEVSREFIYSKDKADLGIRSSEIKIRAVSCGEKKKDLEVELARHVDALGLPFDGKNSTEIYIGLHKNGVNVKDYIGNKSFTGFLNKMEKPKRSRITTSCEPS